MRIHLYVFAIGMRDGEEVFFDSTIENEATNKHFQRNKKHNKPRKRDVDKRRAHGFSICIHLL